MPKAATKKEQFDFQTEVKQLLQLMIHSLYSNRDIFLRELISNASDAADKLRFEAVKKTDLLKDDPELRIEIEFDKKAGTLTIRDNGIGMSREEAIEHLGTIAKSGTKSFIESLSGDQKKDSQMIGQFGVGFYASFMVADLVEVLTRRADLKSSEGVCWSSKGDGAFTVEAIDRPQRGTEIVLHLKKDAHEYLDNHKLRGIVHQYSDHIAIPIQMPKLPDYDDKGKEKSVEGFETVNSAKALWARSRSDITDEEYKEFYKHVSHDFADPLAWSHNRVEGTQEYTSLLYIPSRAPFDLYDQDRKSGLKLYIQRVFIMDNADILPSYLRFVKGVIDSQDLPLNVSREILQDNQLVNKIKSASVKKVLSMLSKMAKDQPDEYSKFWQQFGQVLKEGPGEDADNKDSIAKLLRFSSTQTDNEAQTISLEDYVARMKDGQKHIYYVTADTFPAAKNSPHLEFFRKKGIEVLLLTDRVDEWLVAHLNEFDGKTLQSVAKGKLDDLDQFSDKEEKKAQEKAAKDFEAVMKHVKEALGEKVKEVRLSHRLADSPACVVADDDAMSMHLQRMMAAAGQKMPMGMGAPVLELNPEHRLVAQLKDEQDDTRFNDWAELLFEQAMLAEGGQLSDPAAFVKRVNKYL